MQISSILNSCVVKSNLFKNEYVVLFIFNFVHGKLSLTCPHVKACWKVNVAHHIYLKNKMSMKIFQVIWQP